MRILSILAALLLLFIPTDAMAYTYSYAPTIPTTNTSTGVTSQPLNGITGSCQSVIPVSSGTPNPILNLDCSGDLGLAGSLSATGASFPSFAASSSVCTDSLKNLTTTGCSGGGGGGGQLTLPFSPTFSQATNPFQTAVSDFWSSNAPANMLVDAYNYFPLHTITGLTITCLPYNASLATSAPGAYPYSPTTKMTGGTLQFVLVDNSNGTNYTKIGTITVPDCTNFSACSVSQATTFSGFVITNTNTLVGFYSSAVGTGGEPYQSCVENLIGK
jgi:hypothetical protein